MQKSYSIAIPHARLSGVIWHKFLLLSPLEQRLAMAVVWRLTSPAIGDQVHSQSGMRSNDEVYGRHSASRIRQLRLVGGVKDRTMNVTFARLILKIRARVLYETRNK